MAVATNEIKIRGYHLDIYGHVNNARYLEFLEEGRWVWSEQNMDFIVLKQNGILFSVVNINIDFKRAAYINEEIQVRTSLESLGQKSGVMRQRIVLKGSDKVIVDAAVTFVMIDEKSNKAVNLDGELRDKLGALIEAGG